MQVELEHRHLRHHVELLHFDPGDLPGRTCLELLADDVIGILLVIQGSVGLGPLQQPRLVFLLGGLLVFDNFLAVTIRLQVEFALWLFVFDIVEVAVPGLVFPGAFGSVRGETAAAAEPLSAALLEAVHLNNDIRGSAALLPPLGLLFPVLLLLEADGADVVPDLHHVLVLLDVQLQQTVLQLAVHADHVEGSYQLVAADTLLRLLYQQLLQTRQVVEVLTLARQLQSRTQRVRHPLPAPLLLRLLDHLVGSRV